MDPEFSLFDAIAATGLALVMILLASRLKEPTRQRFMAIFVAGAGSAYLAGGLGPWEFPFAAVASYVAYRGLEDYRFIGLGWLMHTGWDTVHHLYANPIIPMVRMSSAQCAVCDSLLAVWFFAGAPTPSWQGLLELRRRRAT